MKKHIRGKAAFTLVEMLVVIVIISLVAMAVAHALRGAQRQANATKCLANMKNLHSAVVSYLADKNEYPAAASYEVHWSKFDKNGTKKEFFYERFGWVSWIKEKGGRRNSSGKTPWEADGNAKTHAREFIYPANTDTVMRDAISEGALFKYVGKDYSTYKCPEHRKNADGKPVHLAYAMNGYSGKKRGFGSYNERNYYYYKPRDIDKDEKNASKIALFIEIDEGSEDSSSADRKGQPAVEALAKRVLPDDCCWNCADDSAELGRFSHRRGSKNYSHVVFMDGHVAAIPEDSDADDPEDPGWNGHANIKDVFKSLGDGTF